MPTPADLHTELTTDPLALGYASHINISDNAIADMLNAKTGAGAAAITLAQVGKGAVLLGTVPVLDQLASGLTLAAAPITPEVQAKWQNRFSALRAGSDTLACSPQFIGMLMQLVSDGLTQQPYIDAIIKRAGSRAEVLWGAGTVVQPSDVQAALGR